MKVVLEKQKEQAKNGVIPNTDDICFAFSNGFLDANEELFSGIMDIRFSGSTCVSIMTLG